MNKRIFFVFYSIFLVLGAIFSWGFVDSNMPFRAPMWLSVLAYHQRTLATIIYGVFVLMLFGFYVYSLRQVQKKLWGIRDVWKAVGITIAILFFSYPAFSFDVFNYIATAKVAFLYRENPYLVMPIEIPNEPMLTFLHASNKVALYGPVWILLTSFPHYLGFGDILLSVFAFKALVIAFYILLARLIWKISNNAFAVAFFALNPLVIMETLLGGHNDVVMMYLALLAFFLLQKKKLVLSLIVLGLSILIKGATVMLVPVFVWAIGNTLKGKKNNWNIIWFWCAVSMYTIFFLSPIREEIYAWYLIWPLTFVALIPGSPLLRYITFGFSFGLLFRIVPFLYTRQWIGITPMIKKLVTFIPPALLAIYYEIRKNI